MKPSEAFGALIFPIVGYSVLAWLFGIPLAIAATLGIILLFGFMGVVINLREQTALLREIRDSLPARREG